MAGKYLKDEHIWTNFLSSSVIMYNLCAKIKICKNEQRMANDRIRKNICVHSSPHDLRIHQYGDGDDENVGNDGRPKTVVCGTRGVSSDFLKEKIVEIIRAMGSAIWKRELRICRSTFSKTCKSGKDIPL